MKLTGKCKQDFLKKHDCGEIWFDSHYMELFQNALIIEFFDSVGIYISIKLSIINFEAYVYDNYIGRHKSRTEATNEAIIKANEIFNLNNK